MKAISVMPPWPWAIFHLGKDIENRNRRWSHRGPLLIHASKTWDQEGYDFIANELCLNVPPKSMHVFGEIVGVTYMLASVLLSSSKWFRGPYGYVLKDSREFRASIPWRGMPGPFDVPDEVIDDSVS